MAHVIAVAGKGGVGKTTLCGMLIQYLCEQGKGPILAVDAYYIHRSALQFCQLPEFLFWSSH